MIRVSPRISRFLADLRLETDASAVRKSLLGDWCSSQTHRPIILSASIGARDLGNYSVLNNLTSFAACLILVATGVLFVQK